MMENRYKCLKCNSFFWEWGKKAGKYGGLVDCCPNCGNTDMASIQKNVGFGWTDLAKKSMKLRIGVSGIIVLLIGFILCFYITYAGLALMSIGMIVSLFAILMKSDKSS